jgi:PAS domain-containing protein
VTIPSSDRAFADHVNAVHARHPTTSASEFERRLRSLFPRVVVRERSLSGESASWYVYRDGAWRSQLAGPWWREPGLPRLVISEEGWVVEANRTARDLLGIPGLDSPAHHLTDFVVPGALEQLTQLFDAAGRGSEIEATILLRPLSGDVIAIDLHAAMESGQIIAVFRLAADVDVPSELPRLVERPKLTFVPAIDVAFRAYAERALDHMPEPTPSGLELRMRRLYPHSSAVAGADAWVVYRDREGNSGRETKWWLEPGAACVRYDAQALILDANEAATRMFGRELVGHHWQEFVTPGSTEQVTVMLAILAEAGAAESRFRMPKADGSLLEFDSYTEVAGDEFTTVFRPVDG